MAITGDCKSPAVRLRRFESYLQHQTTAVIAQLVERIHGKDEVPSSNLGHGSTMDKIAIWSPSRAAFCVAARWTPQDNLRQGRKR